MSNHGNGMRSRSDVVNSRGLGANENNKLLKRRVGANNNEMCDGSDAKHSDANENNKLLKRRVGANNKLLRRQMRMLATALVQRRPNASRRPDCRSIRSWRRGGGSRRGRRRGGLDMFGFEAFKLNSCCPSES